MPNRYFRRNERKAQVELALKIKADNGGLPEGSAWAIAKLLDVAVAPNFLSILADMVAEHRLNVRIENLGARGDRRIYILADYQRPEEPDRVINLRINGQVYQKKLL